MELDYDAILLNTAVAKAGDPVAMARAFALGPGRTIGLRSRPDGAAGHGGALHPGDRQGLVGLNRIAFDLEPLWGSVKRVNPL